MLNDIQSIRECAVKTVNETTIVDMHTHIYPATFGELLLWGIDELLTYHYLIAEVFRAAPITYKQFWGMSKTEQADLIWDHLFIKRSPVSEACRGVLTCLEVLGLDPPERDLGKIRKYFAEQNAEGYIETVFTKSNVSYAVMTNDPFDPYERQKWQENAAISHRFKPVLRVDPVLADWDTTAAKLKECGVEVSSTCDQKSLDAIRTFLDEWIAKMNPLYMAVSLTPDFRYPDESSCTKVIENCILPAARDNNIPFAMMIGVNRQVNPQLQLAGDSVGKSDIQSVTNILAAHPDNRFFVTMLSRENQHELCVTARKFPNLMIFGCWWFMNNPSIIEEITRERIELLGLSCIPQHSDARVLDQLLYKWKHSRRIIGEVMADKYADIAMTGWKISEEEIKRDVELLLAKNFENFVGKS